MTPRLKISIDNLYDTFSKYQANSNMHGSPNYDDLDAWNKDLFVKQLRELTAVDLSRFLGKAMTTWGDTNDYKHFLPRIFELTAQLNTPYEIWIAFDKLEYGQWSTWEDSEVIAIHNYMLALWDSLLKTNTKQAEWSFKDYFSTFANFYPTFADLIDIWDDNTQITATKHLANYILDERHQIFDKGFIDGFHKKYDNIKEFKTWLLSDSTRKRLEQAFFRYEKENFAEKLSWAEKILNDEARNAAHNIGIANSKS
jgi:hypothetical protein